MFAVFRIHPTLEYQTP